MIFGNKAPLGYRVVDPHTGEILRTGVRNAHTDPVPDDGHGPRVYICYDDD